MSYKDKRVKLESKGDLVEVKEGARCESEADALRETEAGAGWTNKARRLGDFSVAGESVVRSVGWSVTSSNNKRVLLAHPLGRRVLPRVSLHARASWQHCLASLTACGSCTPAACKERAAGPCPGLHRRR